MNESPRQHVAIVGAGISGLCAAWELTGGAHGPSDHTPSVVLIDADSVVGGKVRALALGSRQLDAGPDGALARRPELADLANEIGLGGDLMPIAARGAAVFARGHVRPLPEGLALGVPTRFGALRRSKVLSLRGLLRAFRDVVTPAPPSRGHLQDRAIGSLIGTKLGDEVVTTLIDPMIGGINAGRVAEMSAAAIYPGLLDAAQQRGSLMKAMRPFAPPPPEEGGANSPAFLSLRGGMHAIPERLESLLHERGVHFIMNTEVTSLVRQGGAAPGWAVNSATTTTLADAVILCAPTFATASLLRTLDPEVAGLLEQIDYASVAIATFTFRADEIDLPPEGTGVLVPPGSRVPHGPRAGEKFLTTALTFLDRKWPHLAREGELTLRVHCGKIDDDRIAHLEDDVLLNELAVELGALVEVRGTPLQSALQRWTNSLPQYRVNHLLRVQGIEAAIARQPRLDIAGAALHGVGVPACITSGRAAGRRVLAATLES